MGFNTSNVECRSCGFKKRIISGTNILEIREVYLCKKCKDLFVHAIPSKLSVSFSEEKKKVICPACNGEDIAICLQKSGFRFLSSKYPEGKAVPDNVCPKCSKSLEWKDSGLRF